jgi:hypothetical protein
MKKTAILISIVIVVIVGTGFFIFKSPALAPVSDITPAPLNTTNKIIPIPITSGILEGHVTIGPICPVERVDQPCPVPPETYTSRNVIVYESDGTTVKEKILGLDAQGNYKMSLSPGKYFVQIVPAGIRAGEKKPATIKVNETTIVDFNIDTGIR